MFNFYTIYHILRSLKENDIFGKRFFHFFLINSNMPGMSRKTTDSAGAPLITGSANVRCNGTGVVRIGDTVQAHEIGVHARPPQMITGSSTVRVNGSAVCKAGDTAACLHAITGSPNVNVGSASRAGIGARFSSLEQRFNDLLIKFDQRLR